MGKKADNLCILHFRCVEFVFFLGYIQRKHVLHKTISELWTMKKLHKTGLKIWNHKHQLENRCLYIWWLYLFLPLMIRFGPQTSIVSFLHALITQWYSNEEHACDIFPQPFFTAAVFHSLSFCGHDFTFFAVAAESSHLVELMEVFRKVNIHVWTLR